jgi:GlpG protein
MRLIGSVTTERQARNLSAWLIAEGIDTHTEPSEEGFEIWIRHEDQLDLARKELIRFQENPDDSRYSQALSRAAEIEKEKSRRQKTFEKNVVHGARRPASMKTAPLTILLILISSVVALFTNFGEGEVLRNTTYQALAFGFVKGPEAKKILAANDQNLDAIPVRLASLNRGEVWRALTPMFIHFGTTHIIFNMIMLFQLGRLIEIRYGTVWLGCLVLVSAALSNIAQGVVPEALQGSPPNVFSSMMITSFGGMSGVVYGLFGFIWIKSVIDPNCRMYLPASMIIIAVAWLLLCMSPLAERFGLHVANWAHGVGLASGILAAFVTTALAKRSG